MSVPVPEDFTAAQAPTAGQMSSYIVSSVQALLSPPCFRASGQANQAVPVGSTFNPTWTVQEDTNNGFSTSKNYYVSQLPGWYAVTSTITIGGLSSGCIGSYSLVVSSSGVQQPPVMFTRVQGALNPQGYNFYADVYLQQDDWVFPVFQSNSTAAGSIWSPGTLTSFEAIWFGA